MAARPTRAEHFPLFRPLNLLGIEYFDTRGLPYKNRRESAQTYQLIALQSVVPELLCDSPVRDRVGDDRGGFDLSTRDMVADIFPVNFASFSGDRCTDAFGLYAIKKLSQDESNWRVTARIQPGFLEMIESDEMQYIRLIIRLMEDLSDTRLPLQDGKMVDIVTMQIALAFLPESDERHSPQDRRAQLMQEEMLGKEGVGSRHESREYKQGRLHDVGRVVAP